MINMKRFLLTIVLLAPTPSFAEACADLWFTRNLIMDRAGYCFGSNLGRAVFDNADCVGKSVSLTVAARRQVAEIKALERQFQCRVNTRGRSLELPDIELRRGLEDLPVRDEFESGCIGWQQGTTPLHAGRDPASRIIGQITDGDYVSFSHVPAERWTYVTTHTDDGTIKSAGWLGAETTQASCRQWAG